MRPSRPEGLDLMALPAPKCGWGYTSSLCPLFSGSKSGAYNGRFSGLSVFSFLCLDMPDAPVYHDPDNVSEFLQFGAHTFLWAPLGLLCGLIVLPRFWSTRIFALNLYAARIVVLYALRLISACVWRNHGRYIPIYSDACEDIDVAPFGHSLTYISRLARTAFERDTPHQFSMCCQVFVDLFDAGWDDSRLRSGASHLCRL